MTHLLGMSRAIDAATRRLGRWVAWLVVAAALVSAANAIIRKLQVTTFGAWLEYHLGIASSNAWLELQWWLFGMVFLLAAPWTLALNEHIRIDIVSNRLPRWARNTIEILGHVFFLLPTAAVVVITSWPFFLRSAPSLAELGQLIQDFTVLQPLAWLADLMAAGEQSANAGGLPQWPAKLLIPLGFLLLFVQGLSELIKRIAIMSGTLAEAQPSGGFHPAALDQHGHDEPR